MGVWVIKRSIGLLFFDWVVSGAESDRSTILLLFASPRVLAEIRHDLLGVHARNRPTREETMMARQ